METVREQICRREREYLCPEACLSENTRGRAKPLSEETLRTEFQRDRDRIIHCKSFRRLMHKTQVFLCPEDDHYRTRLTHTLEVAQIARTIARSLFVNEDLAEAIALGHDLGHTPFGHAGERMLNQLLPGGFRHSEQSLRVVDVLENLNLTYEVRDGILRHTNGIADTVEGQIVRISDRIAYINHDIDDALRGGVISDDSIPLMLQNVLGYGHGERIDTMVTNVVRHGIVNGRVGMDGDVGSATEELHELLFKIVYTNPKAKGEEGRAEEMVGRLYEFYRDHPDKIPPQYAKDLENDGVERCTADFISGMTDRYAISNFKQLFIPKVWQGPVD